MSSVFDNHSDIVFACPLQGICNLLRGCDIHGIHGVISDGTSLLSRICITGNAGSVRKDRIARVVRPDGIVDADRVLSMPRGVEPLSANCPACIIVVVWLVGIAY